MIVSLEGILSESSPLRAVIECAGVGYEVHIPVTTAEKLPPSGQSVRLHTVSVYREDSQSLYGFYTREEKDFFVLLTEKVSGIGPKTALTILSKLSLQVLADAISRSDIALLSKCPGIGKKTAERICVELKDKMGLSFTQSTASRSSSSSATSLPAGNSRIQDAVSALTVLGYKLDMADKAVRQAAANLPAEASVEALIRAALK